MSQKVATSTAALGSRGADGKPLSAEEQQVVRELRSRDREVRAHEQAHMAAGGPYVSGPYYDYQKGPDGQRYAVGGSVNIDASPIPDDPAATVRKMDVVIRAALAPAEPSGQDMKVAAEARQTKIQAQAEVTARRAEDFRNRTATGTSRGGIVDIQA